MRHIIIAAIVICLTASVSFAQVEPVPDEIDTAQLQKIFTEANELFRRANELAETKPVTSTGLYKAAADRFEQLARRGMIKDGRLFYNIANSHFLAGDLGRAILNYRRADRYISADRNLNHNLSYARRKCIDKIEPGEQSEFFKTVLFWHYDLPIATRAILFAIAYILLWTLAAWNIFSRRSALRPAVIVCLLLTAALAGSLTANVLQISGTESGVILASEVTARKGNSTAYQPSFTAALHEGTEFTVIEDRDRWLYIELPDGRKCWIPAETAELI
ncbi:MAG: hypothetical protein KAR47_02975 [Planctomycetes bacterium]|nr:hypothetical protein [Planctomycetota bacterium]